VPGSVCPALVARLADADRVVEVGIGRETAVASALAARGVAVTATDIRPRSTPPGVAFAVDDITAPTRSLYAGADIVYAVRLPPELHRPAADIARDVGAELLFTTLGGDPPAVPVDRETLPSGTLFVAKL